MPLYRIMLYSTNKFSIPYSIVKNDYRLNNLYIEGQVLKRLLVKRKNQQLRVYKRFSRIKRFIYQELLKDRYVYFSTFTFDDKHLPFNRKSFVEYLKRTCKLNYCLYCDYGDLNNRFHLHGFISSLDKCLTNDFNRFGFTKFSLLNVDYVNFDNTIKYTIDYSNKVFYDFRLIVGQSYKNYNKISIVKLLDIYEKVYKK